MIVFADLAGLRLITFSDSLLHRSTLDRFIDKDGWPRVRVEEFGGERGAGVGENRAEVM